MRILALLSLAVLLAGCTSSGTGTLNLHVTDAPDAIGDFAFLNVTVEKITLTPKDGKAKEYAPSHATFDLTQLVGGNLTTLFAGKVDAANYSKLELTISNATGVLKNGSTVSVKAPSARLFLTTSFEVAEGKETDFTFDIQVHQEGNGDYIFSPNATGSGPKKGK
jgi:hypothetical protein